MKQVQYTIGIIGACFCLLFGKTTFAQQTFEKSFRVTFADRKANQVAYVQLPHGIPIYGYLEIEITGGHNHQLTRGVLRKRIDIVFNGSANTYLSQESHIEVASGHLVDQWQIGDFDGITCRVPIYHLVSSGNNLSVSIRGNLIHTDYVAQIKEETTIIPPQEVLGLSIKRPYRNFTDSRIGIGTDSPQSRLDVNGKIRAHEIKVETANWPDYVFQPDYELKPLSEVAAFIKENGHLPEVPKAAVVEADGVSLGEMNKILLKKVEELTLHLIEMKSEIKQQAQEIETLKSIKTK